MLRLFVALRPPSPIRDLLLDRMAGIPGARWQDDAQLHLTLRFIGDVDERVAEDIDAALRSIVSPAPAMRIDGVGQFDRRGRPTAVWAGLEPRGSLADLHRRVDRALVCAGLAPEQRAYRPHVTLARLNAGSGAPATWLRQNAGLASDPWISASFGLFHSILGRSGARYESLARYPLDAR